MNAIQLVTLQLNVSILILKRLEGNCWVSYVIMVRSLKYQHPGYLANFCSFRA